jgi:hypothetical protein
VSENRERERERERERNAETSGEKCGTRQDKSTYWRVSWFVHPDIHNFRVMKSRRM